MTEPVILGDGELDSVLAGEKPVLLLLTNGENLRGDFNTAFKKAAAAHSDIVFARIDPTNNPQAARRFSVSGSKPVLLAWHCGEVLNRRSRPWGPDVDSIIEIVKQSAAANNPAPAAMAAPDTTDEVTETPKEQIIMADNAPVTVTDQTFQAEVIDYHLPVVVDFWAPWCGPCKMVGPILDKLAEEYAGKLRIAKVNVDENPALSQSFQVMSIPTIMMLKEKHIVFSQPGALPEPALRDLFEQLIALEIPEHEGHDHGQGEEATAEENEPAN